MPTYEIADLTVSVDFTCHEFMDGELTDTEIAYRAKVEFDSLNRLLEYGGESVKRVLQTWARKGKFPKGERVTVKVGEKVKFPTPITKEDAERLNDEEAAAMYRFLQERMQAKAAAEMAAMAEDEPKTQKVKPKK